MRTTLIVLGLAAAAATAIQAADATAGKAVYDKSCKSCHGADGTANPAIAKMMKVDIKDLKSADVQAMSDDDLKKVITDGKGKMKPIASASGSAADVVAYIRTWKK
ncbi:MAG: cytochrome c [Bryobacteraceae bacterium]|jgi:mono/diheme cytochrome c family protein